MISRQPTAVSGEYFQIIPEYESKKLVVYFTATTASSGLYNFWKAGNAIKTNRIFVSSRRSWYQNGVSGLGSSVEETVESIFKWAEYLNVEEIYTVGGSMGGYGAVLLGCLLNARIMAFSFETELDLEGSRSRKLMDPGTEIKYRDLKSLIEGARKPIFAIIGEQDAIDCYSISRVIEATMLKAKSMRGIMHGPQFYLNENERLVSLLEDFLQDFDEMPKMREDGDIFDRIGFPELFYEVHKLHARRQWDATLERGREALKIMPMSDQCNWLVGEALMRLERFSDAYPYIFTAISLNNVPMRHSGGNARHFHLSLANCLRRMNHDLDAINMYKELMSAWPEHAPVHYGLGLSYLRVGKLDLAGFEFREASRIEPQNETYASRARKYAKFHGLT